MTESIKVQIANSKNQLDEIFDIRRIVFVVEQQVDEREEYDEFETSCTHLIALYNDKPVGTCRFRNTDKGIKLERFAVLKEFRNKAIGAALVRKVLELIDLNQHIYLHAQIQVVDFYAQFGFKKVGEQFVEANIKHYKMVL
ncbi:MAG: GNAT family N-acetyltransferase [Bacteroidia bacterium]|nr:GNAT family N-acetyltransferase [Bacteroidia bacterium]NNJ56243.1 GNAT family N-acetyltransferase [Bacteroidia bacterium]